MTLHPPTRCLGLALVLSAALATSSRAPSQTAVGPGDYPHAAYSEAQDVYLVVFETAGLYSVVMGQLIRPDGTLVGGRFFVSPTAVAYGASIRGITTVASTGDFAVLSTGGNGGKYSSSLFPLLNTISGGTVSRSVAFAGTSDFFGDAAVGGEETQVADDVVVVAYNHTQGALQAFQVDSVTGTLVRRANLASGPVHSVAISPTGGQPGRYLVTWHRDDDLYGCIIDRNLNVLVSEFPISLSTAYEGQAAVDGDGTNWMVTYLRITEIREADVMCRSVAYDERSGTAVVSTEVAVDATPGQRELEPAVCWTGESYVVGFSEQFSGADYDLYLTSVESFHCRPCQGRSALSRTLTLESKLRLAAGPGRNGGLAVWTDNEYPGLIFARPFGVTDGEVVDLGGGCGQGGTASATCAAVGVPSVAASAFGMRTQHAAPSASGWLVLGANRANLACGPCTLVPDPVAVLPATTDPLGNSEVSFQIRANLALRGQSLLAQWLLVAPGGCSLGLSMSNAIQVTIE